MIVKWLSYGVLAWVLTSEAFGQIQFGSSGSSSGGSSFSGGSSGGTRGSQVTFNSAGSRPNVNSGVRPSGGGGSRTNGGQQGNGGGGLGGCTCRQPTACALQFSPDELSRHTCTLGDGSTGICCSSPKGSSGGGVFPNPELSLRSPSFGSVSVRLSVDVGQSFLSNVTQATNSFGTTSEQSPAGRHNRFQKARDGVIELNKLALTAMATARNLEKGSTPSRVKLRQADISNSILDFQCPKAPGCSGNAKYRNIDGTCNNLRQPKYGELNTRLQRILRNAYGDGFNFPRQDRNNRQLPSARLVSSRLAPDISRLSSEFTAIMMPFGQFVDHDLTHVPVFTRDGNGVDCCTSSGGFAPNAFNDVECLPIEIPNTDPFFRKSCMNFVRSMTAPNLDCSPGPSEQINQITHWLDSSNVYGSDDREARNLRGPAGRLRTSRSPFGGKDLLPDDRGVPDCQGRKPCFVAGDGRVNEQPGLTAMHTIFMREHNRVVEELERVNPQWNDETLYQEAKRVVNAEWQHIVYNEWLRIVVGRQLMTQFDLWPRTQGHSRDYRDNFDPTITNEFAAAAFRFGHSLVPDVLELFRRIGSSQSGQLDLKDLYFNPDLLRQPGMLDQLLKGMTLQRVENVDNNFANDITKFLFDGNQGMDLVALNIQRGRDHGIPGYSQYLKICQISSGNSWDSFSSVMSRQAIQNLQSVYDSHEDVDLFVGMMMENVHRDALVGRTFLCIIGDQFLRLKKGDRFFYDLQGQSGSFTINQLNEIRKASMARLICDNSDGIEDIQPLVFQRPNNNFNPLTSCFSNTEAIPRINFDHWRA